jgi:hypothetical protein
MGWVWVTTYFRSGLCPCDMVIVGMHGYKWLVIRRLVNNFTVQLSPLRLPYFTSVSAYFSPLSTPLITNPISIKKNIFVIEQGA